MSPSGKKYRRPVRTGKQSTVGEKAAENIRQAIINFFANKAVRYTLSALIILVILTVGLNRWYDNVYANPERVFWDMISNNLKTTSVTKEINQTNSAGSKSNELSQLSVNSNDPKVREVKKVTASNGSAPIIITVESIGTPKDVYQHYVLIEQPNKSKEKYKDVYPLWIKNAGGNQSNSVLFNQKVLDSAVIFGNLTKEQRQKTVDYMRKAYDVKFDSVKKEKIDGRRIFVYNAKLKLKNYFTGVQYYAKSMGLSEAKEINPNNYKSSDQFPLVFTVDVMSRQIRLLNYTSTNTKEIFSGYGIKTSFEPPLKTVGYNELQTAVQKASK